MRFNNNALFDNFKYRIKKFFGSKTPLSRLILYNIIVYVLVLGFRLLFNLFGFLTNSPIAGTQFIIDHFAISSNFQTLLYHPWSWITSLFLHYNFTHLFFNMLTLLFSGYIFLQYFKNRDFYLVYFIGGLLGNLLYVLSYNYFPIFQSIKESSFAMGASGAIMAILVAIACKVPNYEIQLLLFGRIKLKWLAIIFVIIDIISIPYGNSGGHFAHLGGAFFGGAFVFVPQIFAKYHFAFNKPWKHKHKTYHQNKTYSRPKTDEQYNTERAENRKKLDAILEKISKSGYNNLTKEEKAFLFDTSNNKKNI